MWLRYSFLGLVLILLSCESHSLAQDSSAQNFHNYFWIDGGIGTLESPNLDGDAATISFSHLSGIGLITLRYTRSRPLYIYLDHFSATNKPFLDEIGFLYGRAFDSRFIYSSASIGLSVLWGNTENPSPDNQFTNMCVPVDFQAFVKPFPVIGLGVKILGNLNTGSSFIGGFLCLRIGFLHYVEHNSSLD